MKKLILAAAFVLTATSASLAQGIYAAPDYGRGYYNSAPGYGYNDRYGYRGGYNNGGYNNHGFSGPNDGSGPLVGPGDDMGIASQR